MTRQQQKLLRFIEAYILANEGMSPTYDEMMSALGLQSKSNVHRMVGYLLHEGRLIKRHYGARGLSLPESCAPTIDQLRTMPRDAFKAHVANVRAVIEERNSARRAA